MEIMLGLGAALYPASLALFFWIGYQHGHFRGRLAERERRDRELDEKIAERMKKLVEQAPDIWESEIDV